MAYIGRDIDNGLLTKQTFTGVNGSTTVFTLDQSVGDATSLIVSVAGVIQEPNVAFTANDDTLTFTGAPANGATVWAIYIGKEVLGEGASNTGTVAYQTGTGDTTTTPITLSQSVGGTSEILVALNGVAQVPDTEYTVSGTTLTFASGPANGVGILVYYFGAAGLLNVVADGAVTAAGFAASGTLPAWNGNALTNLDSADLSGTLPALNSSNLTGLVEGLDTTSASDPTVTTNPGTGVGTMWLNSSSGELYCCTDATTNDNVWKNVGGGAGHIQAPTNPNDTFPDLAESSTTNFTFAGGTDDGTVTHYMVDQISNTSLLGVTTSEVAAGAAHSFVTQAVGSDTSVTFRVRTKDNLGLYSPGITITTIILNNVAPTNPTNGGAFADMNQSTSYNYTFAGATDADGSVTHYMVDQISNAALTVSAAEVTATSAHTFNAGAVGSDTAVTFRVRAKDNDGEYSSGVTVSMTVKAIVYTVATGGTITTSGSYKIHTFNSSDTFEVTTLGNTDDTVEYLVVAGGGGGAMNFFGGGGGAGGYRTASSFTVSETSYPITIGAGGATGAVMANANAGSNSVFSSITSIGGGYGSGYQSSNAAGNGGSGGGGCGQNDTGAGAEVAGSGTSGQGNNGGNGSISHFAAGGGGGAGAVGVTASSTTGGAGGAGTSSSITGSAVYRAGGGGGSSKWTQSATGAGGNGGGGSGASSSADAVAGTTNTGGGGGGGCHSNPSYGAHDDGKAGGSGVVIIKYQFQA